MLARAELIAAAPVGPGPPWRVVRALDAPPVAWRPTAAGVYLVNSAASPVGDDEVDIHLAAEAGARLRVRSTAATIAWRSHRSRQGIRARVADGACLDWHLEPMIATAGCRHRQEVAIAIEGAGRLHWTEELVLGRHGEGPGRVDLRLDVERDGAPLLRHGLVLGTDEGWDGPAVVGGHRCVGLALRVGDRARPPVAGVGWARMELPGPAELILAVADDRPGLQRAFAEADG